jgi:protein-tyrosine phosphatase
MKSIGQHSNNTNNMNNNTIKSFDCIICGENDTKYCKDCYRNLCRECIENGKTINFVVRYHKLCIKCKDKICCYKKICYKCDTIPFHMITENIAIGSCMSKYDEFDVILNANYPENEAPENDITVQKIKNKLIIHVGLIDSDNNEELSFKFLKDIIPVIYSLYNDKRILFHCFSGISRSAMFCIAYLSYSLKISIDEAHNMVKNNRDFIEINKGFVKALYKFNSLEHSVYQTD